MLTACCQHKRNCGCPYLHNKDVIVQNLQLLFAQILKVIINDDGSVKDWFKEASHEAYWKALVQCLLDMQPSSHTTHYVATPMLTQLLRTPIFFCSTK